MNKPVFENESLEIDRPATHYGPLDSWNHLMKSFYLPRFQLMVVLCVWCNLASHSIAQPANEETLEFNRDIRPILSDMCFACHGPDKNARQADLRLDDRDAAIAYSAIVPRNPQASEILNRIRSSDPDSVMPPPKTGKTLTEEQVATLERWIAQGASYQRHWAFRSVPQQITAPKWTAERLANHPAVTSLIESAKQKDSNTGTLESSTTREELLRSLSRWDRSPIDQFILDRLLAMGRIPASEADPLTWLRRTSFDLTGLPPAIGMVESILADSSEANRERLVDALLSSDAYGERMANLWLDVARYADTFGYQSDVNMEVWPWRDWVIQAFKNNLPYDEFITWQLAGDLLPNATQEQRLATTFNRLHRQTNEGGSIEEEFRQVYIADRTVTAGTAFLGLTLECSRCHAHKYDPISQQDFYSLAAFFADIDEHGLYSHFTRATPTPAMHLYTPDQQDKHRTLLREIEELEKRIVNWDASHRDPASVAKKLVDLSPPAATWSFPLDGTETGLVGTATKFNGDDAVAFPLNQPHPTDQGKTIQKQFGRETSFSFSIWLYPDHYGDREVIAHQSVAAEDAAFRGLQLVLDQGKPQFSLIHFWPGDALRVQATEAIPLKTWTHIAVTYDGSSRAQGIRLFVNGQQISVETIRDQLKHDFRYRGEWGDSNVGTVSFSLGARFRDVGFRDGLMDALEIFSFELSAIDVAKLYFKQTPSLNESKRAEIIAQLSQKWEPSLMRGEPEYDRLLVDLEAKRKEENDFISGIRQVMTMSPAIVKRQTFVLERGAYDSPREAVPPLPLTKLSENPEPGIGDKVPTRMDLARWMTSDRNPLTSRVAVNRWWSVFFGRGIVSTLEDFGSQGAVPTHPELLDWLARDFMDSDWDIKRFCKSIVLSATYRQSSISRIANADTWDPENKWLSHGPRHRLSAEQVRDAALFVSGLLVPKVGGPSVMPYQPPGVWEEAGTGKSYSQAKGEGLYRRSMYTFWRRTAPPPSMLTFDATSRETCTARRETTTTPLQALVLLNDPQYIEAARNVAQQVLKTTPNTTGEKLASDRFQQMALRILSRRLSPDEEQVMKQTLQEQLEYFGQNKDSASAYLAVGDSPKESNLDSVEFASYSVVAGLLMCFDDFIMKR